MCGLIVEMGGGLPNLLPRLAFNLHPSDLCLLNSWNYVIAFCT
jgi:hypothetical protein